MTGRHATTGRQGGGAGARRRHPVIDDRLIADVTSRLRSDQRVRQPLPGGGRLAIDRPLPFVVVYRPPGDDDDAGTRHLVSSEASYAVGPADRRSRPRLRQLGLAVATTLADVFGGVLLIEVWSGPDGVGSNGGTPPDGVPPSPAFRIVTSRRFESSSTVQQLVRSLGRVRLFKQPAEVEVAAGARMARRGMAPLLTAADVRNRPVHVLGIEVRPVYRSPETGEEYAIARRHLARQFSRALRETCFEFARRETTARPRHYQALGSRSFSKAARDVDRALADISTQFDLLLYVTPTNADAAYRAFVASGFERLPELTYRPRDVDPSNLKRRLHAIDVDRVDDPTVAHLLREKRNELDLKLSMLIERETPRFLPLGVALFGDVSPALVGTADELLRTIEPPRRRRGRRVEATRLVAAAQRQLDAYRHAYPPLASRVVVRDDITSLMVSRGDLLVGTRMTFAPERVEPLLHHEIGTHVVTHWNGLAQPLVLLSVGLAHYDELQEGLAVFAEHLVAGLTAERMRVLAGRVVAARQLLDGAAFREVFCHLRDERGFVQRAAWQITMRAFRGGGFVKDSIYLRGLQSVLDHLAGGGHLETLLVGKVAVEHAPFVEELQRRQVLAPPPLRPAYLDDPDAQARLDRARSGLTLADLVEP